MKIVLNHHFQIIIEIKINKLTNKKLYLKMEKENYNTEIEKLNNKIDSFKIKQNEYELYAIN
jgi:hypothetical protein